MRYADFIDELRRECLEAPFATLESEARAAAIQFCQQSRVWTEERRVDVEPGEAQVRLRPSQEGRVDQVLKAAVIREGSSYELKKVMDRNNFSDQQGDPRYWGEGRRGPNPVMNLWPVPKNPVTLELYVVLVPQRQSRSIPDHISEVWHDAIIHGALSRLLMQSNKPWTDPQKAAYFKQEFAVAVRDARQKSVSDNWTPMSINLRRWV